MGDQHLALRIASLADKVARRGKGLDLRVDIGGESFEIGKRNMLYNSAVISDRQLYALLKKADRHYPAVSSPADLGDQTRVNFQVKGVPFECFRPGGNTRTPWTVRSQSMPPW
jgi:hypothetical protein